MSYEVTIEGTPRRVQASRFGFAAPANGRSTLGCEIVSLLGAYRPELDDEVVVIEDGVTIFGGTVDDIVESGAGDQPLADIASRLSVTDFNGLADQRWVKDVIPAGTLKAALQVLVTYLATYGVTLDPGQVDGPALPELTYDYRPLVDVLNELVSLTSGAYVWRITAAKVLTMFAIGAHAAPFNITTGDGNTVGDLTVHRSRVNSSRRYANRVIVRGGSPDIPITAIANDAGEQAAHGLVETVIAAPTATDVTVAQALADELLVQSTPLPATVEYQTLRKGVEAGQTQTIIAASRNINNTFLIVSVDLSVVGDSLFLRRVVAVEGSIYQGSWRDVYKLWSSGISQVVAIPATAGPGRQAFFLGGSALEYVQSNGPGWIPVDGTPADPGMQVALDTVARGSNIATVTVRLRATAGSVRARLRNVSDNLVVGTSGVVASATFQTEQFTVVLTNGAKIYQLELLPSLADTDVAGVGYLE